MSSVSISACQISPTDRRDDIVLERSVYAHPISTTPSSSDVPFLSSTYYPSLFTDAGCLAGHAMHTGCQLRNNAAAAASGCVIHSSRLRII